eukprot:352033-Chlamydomonas_euryale.AAC.6
MSEPCGRNRGRVIVWLVGVHGGGVIVWLVGVHGGGRPEPFGWKGWWVMSWQRLPFTHPARPPPYLHPSIHPPSFAHSACDLAHDAPPPGAHTCSATATPR